jgi:cell division protein ZapE
MHVPSSALAAGALGLDAAQRPVLERLEALRRRLLDQPRTPLWRRWLRQLLRHDGAASAAAATRGIYIHGGVGRGKTMLMDLFYDSLGTIARRRSHFHHFMRDVHQRLRQLRARRAPLAVLGRELATQLRVLCLDELYVSDIADAMILGGLFESLLRHGVVLVITSNLAPRELYRDGLQRSRFLPTIALLEQQLEQCPLGPGIDYRLRQLQREPIYLDSRAADTAERMQRLFIELAGGSARDEAARSPELRLQGRAVPTVRCRADVVWFEFVVLCAGARSQNDYLQLAQEFRTVMLSDVPLFESPEQDDAARRFIALVDEFYDQATKLVLSAAAAPAALYRGGRLLQEFQRTASRLVEMQTPDYLARERRG